MAQRVGELFGEAITEIFIFIISTDVLERQDGDRVATSPAVAPRASGRGRRRPSAAANWAAEENRSAGRVANAFHRRIDRFGHQLAAPAATVCGLSRLAITADTVLPRKGGSPTSISKSTQARL